MGSIAGSKKLKRQMAPTFWGINRKEKKFVITVRPGSHQKNNSIPTAVLIRDTLKKVKTLREAKSTIYGGKVKVDGVIQKSLHHSIGLMDVVELEGTTDVYRLVPNNGKILKPIKIDTTEKSKKLVRVKTKSTIKGGKTQLGFHDGRTIITDMDANVDDTCVLQIPEQKILGVIKFEKNSQVIVTRGTNAGRIGLINEIGVSVYSPREAERCMNIKFVKHIQIPFNLLDQRWLKESFKKKLKFRPDIKIHARSIFLQGLLLNKQKNWPKWFKNKNKAVQNIELISRKFKKKNKADLCLSYVKSFNWIDFIIIGINSLKQFKNIIRMNRNKSLNLKQRSFVISEMRKIANNRILLPYKWDHKI